MKATKSLTARRILALLREHEDDFRKYQVKRIGLFGSYVSGRERERSDIDLLVEFENPTFDNFMNLTDHLERLLGRRVDVLTPGGIQGIRIREVAERIKRRILDLSG